MVVIGVLIVVIGIYLFVTAITNSSVFFHSFFHDLEHKIGKFKHKCCLMVVAVIMIFLGVFVVSL